MATVAIDFDDTLAGYKKYGEPGVFLPGAADAVWALLKSGRKVVVHSCRANWVEGFAQIEMVLRGDARLARALDRGDLSIWTGEGKPLAKVYLDDRGLRFEGDWTDLVPTLRELSR